MTALNRARNRRKLSRSWERIDPELGGITDFDTLAQRERRKEMLTPKPMGLLGYMVHGKYDILGRETYGGDGKARLNVSGGWGLDRDVRKMISKGYITIHRSIGSDSKHGGSNTINTTVATITDKGRLAYADWEKRMKGRI